MRRGVWLGLVVLVVVAGACGSSVPSIDLPTPPTTTRGRGTTTIPDYSAVALAAIPGRTTVVAPPIAPGSSRISGTVRGPDGPIGGAMVRIERFVGDASSRADLVTRPDGTFETDPILGGRYRARAWRAPDLALDKPVIFYLEHGKNQPVDLAMSRYSGIGVAGQFTSTPFEGDLTTLVVSVTGTSVDADGIVRTAAVSGIAVDLTSPSNWDVFSTDPQATDAAGRAVYQLTCAAEGPSAFTALVGAQSYALELPDCTTPPPSTTTSAAGGTTTTTGLFTTTTRRGGGGGGGRPGPP
jgi:hypothetical protein